MSSKAEIRPVYGVLRNGVHFNWMALIVPIVGLVLWYAGTRDQAHAFAVATPMAVASQFAASVSDGSLLRNIGVTLAEIGFGLFFGIGTAFILGVLIAKSRLLEQAIGPYAIGFQAVPIVAIAPVLIRFLGPGVLTNGLISAFVVFFPMLVSTIVGLRSLDPVLRDMMVVLSATRWQIFTKLELPNALSTLFGGLKISMILAVVGAVVGEAISSDAGLGFMIYLARYTYDTSLVYVGIFTLAALSLILYEIVSRIERRMLRWQQYRGT
jgi:NitT/TauT family transport system permease protein